MTHYNVSRSVGGRLRRSAALLTRQHPGVALLAPLADQRRLVFAMASEKVGRHDEYARPDRVCYARPDRVCPLPFNEVMAEGDIGRKGMGL